MFKKRQQKDYEQIKQECEGKSEQEILKEVHNVCDETKKINQIVKRDFAITMGVLCVTVAVAIDGFMRMDVTSPDAEWSGNTLAALGCCAASLIMMAKSAHNLSRIENNKIDLAEADYKLDLLEELSRSK